ncbi:hypothetical protein BV20DRAFT_1054196 [Pilatotrama ljubarskyi]|nr:hypothetical protein BV20DRAFT_1054196 [Pilatotrama ljubarskyi]
MSSPTPDSTPNSTPRTNPYRKVIKALYHFIPELKDSQDSQDSPNTVDDSVELEEASAASVIDTSSTLEEWDEEDDMPFPAVPSPMEEREPFSTPKSVRELPESPPPQKRPRDFRWGLPPAYDAMDPTMRFIKPLSRDVDM